MKVKICPVCGVILDASQWLRKSCPCCESKQASAPWKTTEFMETSEKSRQALRRIFDEAKKAGMKPE